MVGRKGTGKKKFPICALLAVLCIAALSGWIWFTWEKIPASIRIKAGVSQELSFNVPVSGEVYLSLDEQKEAVPAAGNAGPPRHSASFRELQAVQKTPCVAQNRARCSLF